MIIEYPSTTDYTLISYPGGEFQVRLSEPSLRSVRESPEVVIHASITSAQAAVKLALLADAIHGALGDTRSVHLRLPYLPYARGDRRFVEGDCHGLRAFGRILDSCGFSTVSVLDVHNEKAAKLAIANLSNVDPEGLIARALEHFAVSHGDATAALLFPDAGAELRYRELFAPLNRRVFTASKKRDAATGKLSGFEVPDIHPSTPLLIVDDLCDGGGTFIGIAEALRHHSSNTALYITHSIFSKGVEILAQRFGRIYTTDSFPLPAKLRANPAVVSFNAYEYMEAQWDRK